MQWKYRARLPLHNGPNSRQIPASLNSYSLLCQGRRHNARRFRPLSENRREIARTPDERDIDQLPAPADSASKTGTTSTRRPARNTINRASELGFAHFKRRRRGNLQVGGTEPPVVPACRGQRPTVRNPPRPATGGAAPGRWRPRRSATVCRTRPRCAG